jgi:hypothetical protein
MAARIDAEMDEVRAEICDAKNELHRLRIDDARMLTLERDAPRDQRRPQRGHRYRIQG